MPNLICFGFLFRVAISTDACQIFHMLLRALKGKGTYGNLLTSAVGGELVTAGDILRDHVSRGTDIGLAVRECQLQGRLANDDLVSEAVLSSLIERRYDRIKQPLAGTMDTRLGFILDGFPRTIRQAKIMLSGDKWPDQFRAHVAISIDVPDGICVTKMLGRRICQDCGRSYNINGVDEGGFIMPPTLPNPQCYCDQEKNWITREDDKEEIMKRRIKEFHSETNPVIEWYESIGKLIRFVPYRGVDDIHILVSAIQNYLKR